MNYPRLKALGHMVTERGRCPDIKQIQAIIDICTPECTQDVQHVVGICNFSRDYIPNLAAEIDVLMELIPEIVDVTAAWRDSIHGRALRRIKALLTSAPYLQLPDPTKPYRIHVDGCLKHRGKGAVLLQQSRLWTPPYDPDPTKNNTESTMDTSSILVQKAIQSRTEELQCNRSRSKRNARLHYALGTIP